MPNYPVKPRHQDKLRPPRYDRLRDLSAFLLGYEPCHALAELTYLEGSLAPESERWLRDLPVHLGFFLDRYSIERIGETAKEVLAEFEDYSTEPPPAVPVDLVKLNEEAEEEKEPQSVDSIEIEAGEATSLNRDMEISPDEEMADEVAADVDAGMARPFSGRFVHVFNLSHWGGDQSAHELIRLAQSASERLPDVLQQWFRFGQSIGQCLLSITSRLHTTSIEPEHEDEDRKMDWKTEIQQAASGTDWSQQNVPDLSIDAFRKSEGRSYERWANDMIEWLVDAVKKFLEDDAPVLLSESGSYLWFLGNRVSLTSTECAILLAVAQSVDDTIPREYILQAGLNVSSADEDRLANVNRADQWLQQIVGKLTECLARERSIYYKGTDAATRRWLREEFFPTVPGRGWRKGQLAARMVVDHQPRETGP